jgi:hypothetical protein
VVRKPPARDRRIGSPERCASIRCFSLRPLRDPPAAVTFEPGARIAWQTNPLDQILIVTAGCGRVSARRGRWTPASPAASALSFSLARRRPSRSPFAMFRAVDAGRSSTSASARRAPHLIRCVEGGPRPALDQTVNTRPVRGKSDGHGRAGDRAFVAVISRPSPRDVSGAINGRVYRSFGRRRRDRHWGAKPRRGVRASMTRGEGERESE